jgi:diguanylate cyclase (GGDEF)-like protein
MHASRHRPGQTGLRHWCERRDWANNQPECHYTGASRLQMNTQSWLGRLLYGATHFEDNEEYLAFQFRFLCVLMSAGAVATLVFVLAAATGDNPMDPTHLRMMSVFSVLVLALWAWLRGHKHRFKAAAWLYLALCMVEFSSALVHVSADELRVLWFFLNIPGAYLLLGSRVGLTVTALTVVGLGLGNAHLARPYSPNAMMTAMVVLVYLGLFFHAYSSRSVSYFKRMRQSNERLATLASRDPLTQLLNARAYYQWCDHWLLGAARSGASCTVLFVDLDHFKRINDERGHAAGDEVLKAVATTLSEALRRSDVLGRIGGEEFSIFLPDTEPQQGAEVAEKLRQAIEQLSLSFDGRALRVTASVGVAGAQAGRSSMSAIQQQADQAMYLAKAGGRNRVSMLPLDASLSPT